MDCINFCESPVKGLSRQLRRRRQWLFIILFTWMTWSAGIFIGLHILAKQQAKKAETFMIGFQEMQELMEWQEQVQKSECAAYVLSNLMNLSVRGVSITELSLTDRWSIHGKSWSEEGFSEFKKRIDKILASTIWEEKGLDFSVHGSLLC